MKNSFKRWARMTMWPVVLLSLGMGFSSRASSQEKSAAPKNTSAKSSEATSSGNIENGKKLFLGDGCFECHGTVGQGSTSTGGARIGPPAISLEEMIQYVRHPSGQMPPYTAKVISDENLGDIYAYLKSQPKAQPSKNIPLLNQ